MGRPRIAPGIVIAVMSLFMGISVWGCDGGFDFAAPDAGDAEDEDDRQILGASCAADASCVDDIVCQEGVCRNPARFPAITEAVIYDFGDGASLCIDVSGADSCAFNVEADGTGRWHFARADGQCSILASAPLVPIPVRCTNDSGYSQRMTEIIPVDPY